MPRCAGMYWATVAMLAFLYAIAASRDADKDKESAMLRADTEACSPQPPPDQPSAVPSALGEVEVESLKKVPAWVRIGEEEYVRQMQEQLDDSATVTTQPDDSATVTTQPQASEQPDDSATVTTQPDDSATVNTQPEEQPDDAATGAEQPDDQEDGAVDEGNWDASMNERHNEETQPADPAALIEAAPVPAAEKTTPASDEVGANAAVAKAGEEAESTTEAEETASSVEADADDASAASDEEAEEAVGTPEAPAAEEQEEEEEVSGPELIKDLLKENKELKNKTTCCVCQYE